MKKTKNVLSVAQFIPGNSEYNKMKPSSVEQVYFCKDGNAIRFVQDGAIKKMNLKSQQVIWEMPWQVVCDAIGRDYPDVPKLNFFKADEDTFWYVHNGRILFVNCAQQKITKRLKIFNDWKDIKYNDHLEMFFFTHKNNLCYLDKNGDKVIINPPLGVDMFAGCVPSRHEFGIESGYYFSPDGEKVAFYTVDMRKVAKCPILKHDAHGETLEMIPYPKAGGWSEEVRVCVYNFATKKAVYLKKSDWKESYKTCLTWNPESTEVYIAEVSRSQKECRLNRYLIEDGSLIQTVLTENDNRYVEPENPLFFIKGVDNLFVWQSRRDGYNHLYLYTTEGELLSQLTSGKFEVTKIEGYCENTGEIIFTSNEASPIDRNLYAVKLSTAQIRLLTPEDGTHTCYFSSMNTQFIDVFSSLSDCGKVFLKDFDSDDSDLLFCAKNPCEDVDMPIVEIGTYERSGETMYYRVVKPADYSGSKTYPMIMYVYGGPHVQLIANKWLGGVDGFERMMANEGYLVISIDTHGSAFRGKEFESVIYRNIGNEQANDILYALRLFTSKFKIDVQRLGIYGWSFGGFMSSRMMLKNPDVFKVGVAGGAVTDWAHYEVMYTERYMQKPTENPDGYADNRLKDYIKNLKGKLLMIHCDDDRVVLPVNLYEMQREAIMEGKHIDISIYPGFPHNVRKTQRIHLMETIKDYFLQNL